VVNHRDGGRDPTELELAVQPANTAQPVEATPAGSITPSRLWAACSAAVWTLPMGSPGPVPPTIVWLPFPRTRV